ncbi:hypothetical protein [Microcoleus sp. Pol12B5]|uniref:hypothetical protein n=1 Tax=Microcoleus sp. Pol12B5 TaxID=3055396 RepID=UPI002FD0BD1F
MANQALEKEIKERKRAENERKQNKAALRNSEEQFRNAFENAALLIYSTSGCYEVQ